MNFRVNYKDFLNKYKKTIKLLKMNIYKTKMVKRILLINLKKKN